jgi:hypothetical protein
MNANWVETSLATRPQVEENKLANFYGQNARIRGRYAAGIESNKKASKCEHCRLSECKHKVGIYR